MHRSILAMAAMLPLAFAAQPASAMASESLWRSSSAQHTHAAAKPQPAQFRALQLNVAALHTFLEQTAVRGEALALPRPQGGFDEFVLRDSGTLPAALAAKYPQIRSYVGTTADGREARIDVSPLGFQAMVFDPNGVWIVRPQTIGGGGDYLSFARRAPAASTGGFRCSVHDRPQSVHLNAMRAGAPLLQTTTGTTQRTYRAAVAANHQFVIAASPPGEASVANGLAAVTLTVNRVNQVYEKDFAIHMTLVADNDQLIYPSANGDPYPNGDDALDINTGNVNAVIGEANYDIGHVFTTGSGVAGLGVVCGSAKGEGTTGLSDPVGDAFNIDYVAHEMGHQFGANHTFNGTADGCSHGTRNGPTAYEPGSGSTIMGYAGICGPTNDLQPHSDPYFNAGSLSEIDEYTSGTTGSSCGTNTTNPKAVPLIAPLSNFIIPARTPFVLTGSATTTSSSTLSYGWEQFDLGAANDALDTDTGTGPIIRSLNPTSSGSRTIPHLSNLLDNTTMFGEILPTTNRTLHFRLTARDNAPGFGGSNSADMTVQSVATSGPFAVITPNTAVTWAGGSRQNVSWNVADTTAAPISCNQVVLDLSVDGGLTFTRNLGTFANTGSAIISVPDLNTTQARIRASCEGNIFFNISAPNFTINASSFANPGQKAFAITGATTGSWYNPQQSGQGFVVQVVPGNILAAIWFVFTPDGKSRDWIYAQGTYDPTSNSATIPALLVQNGQFPPSFDASKIARVPWGTITFTFSDCNHGSASWSSTAPGYGSGSLSITRLNGISGLTCQ